MIRQSLDVVVSFLWMSTERSRLARREIKGAPHEGKIPTKKYRRPKAFWMIGSEITRTRRHYDVTYSGFSQEKFQINDGNNAQTVWQRTGNELLRGR